MAERICNCNIPKNLQEAEMAKSIEEYILRLSPEECVEDKVYEKRLGICSSCNALSGNSMCGYCGCFVLARAKKKTQDCPMPGGSRWR